MSDIFEEVEEEVRKDRLAGLWRRYGILVWLLAGALVLAVAFNEYRQAQQAEAREARMETFEAAREALNAGNFETAAAGFETLVESDSRLSPMAAHFLAQARMAGGGDRALAASVLGKAGEADGGAFEKLALLKQAYLRSGEMDLAELEALLSGLAGEETPFGALASEAIASKAYEAGQTDRARQMFNRLRFAAYAPSGLTQRAQIALDAMPAGASGEPATALETQLQPEDENDTSPTPTNEDME